MSMVVSWQGEINCWIIQQEACHSGGPLAANTSSRRKQVHHKTRKNALACAASLY